MSRVKKDHVDAAILHEYLDERNPFDFSQNLANNHTGEVADKAVNVYNAKEVGEKIIQSMVGQDVFSYSFTRKDMVTTMKSKSSVEIDAELVHVDPMLLFQRLILLVGKKRGRNEGSI